MVESKTRRCYGITEIDRSVDVARRSLTDCRAKRANDLIDVEESATRCKLVEVNDMLFDLERSLLRSERAPDKDYYSRAGVVVDEQPKTLLADKARGSKKKY